MAFYRHFIYSFLISFLCLGCNVNEKKAGPANNSAYDLLHPFVIKLPDGLAEISGMAYYPKDSSVFAIVDEDGILYKISLTTNDIRKWRFDKKRDFEDIVLQDSIFHILISNGDVESIKFEASDSIVSYRSGFPDANKKTNEFESLYYDDSLRQLVLLCKNCEADNTKTVSAWGYNINTQAYTPAIFTIDVQPIIEKFQQQKIKLRPSAAAIHPVTNELYILSSINHLLIITDRSGKFKELFTLDPAIYKQAEGIAFTPAGDMIISNESHETGLATILILKYKKKGV